MKHHKILIMITIAFLTILLTGCGPTLEEKITEVQAKNMLTTTDVIDLLELEGVEVTPQKPTTEFRNKWPKAELYKVGGENLLLIQTFEGSFNERNSLVREMEWDIRTTYSPEAIQNILNAYKPDGGIYAPMSWYGGKNIVALYVNYYSAEALEKNGFEYGMDSLDIVKNVFQVDINGMRKNNYTAVGKNFAVTAYMDSYQTPYSYEEPYKGTQYDFYLESRIEIQFFDDVLEQYQGRDLEYKITGPEIGSRQTARTGHTDVKERLNITMKDENVIHVPHTGPIQYEVTVTIGDDITETLIVGTDGTDSSE